MKLLCVTAFIIAAACAPGAARGGEPEENQPTVKCGTDTVVLFKEGVSPDKRYALGWTIRAEKAGVKPVDWSLYTKNGADQFSSDLLTEAPELDYGLYNCFVDLRAKKALDLEADNPYWWRQSHVDYSVFWSPGTGLPRYCLMQNQKRFTTDNLFLIRVDHPAAGAGTDANTNADADAGMSQQDLTPRLEKAVMPLLRKLRPLYWQKMAISTPNSEWDDVYEKPVFRAGALEIQFHADLPKAGYDKVSGHITVSLPAGNVLKVACDTKRDDPFLDDPALAKADAELNNVYAQLQKRPDPGQRAALKKEQLSWIEQRNDKAAESYPMAGTDVSIPAFTRERNKDLVDATRERTAVLRKMLGK